MGIRAAIAASVALVCAVVVTAGPSPARAAPNDADGLLVVAGGWLRTAYPDGSHQRELIPYSGSYSDSQPFSPRFSHDGTKIAYTPGVGGLCVIGLDGSSGRCAGGGSAHVTSWSPDDQFIYFSAGGSIGYESVDGTVSGWFDIENPGFSYRYSGFEWAPDGRHFAVARDPGDGGSQIVIGDPDGRHVREVTTGPGDHIEPHWSSDGMRLVYSALNGVTPGFRTSVVNADGTGQRDIQSDYIAQAWSPDGTRILAYHSSTGALATMRPDGTALAPVGGLGGGADWVRPSARTVATAGGGAHSLAVAADGSVTTWGYNGLGQLGDGTHIDRDRPVRVSGLPPAVSVSAGWLVSAAVTTDGRVWTWGWNGAGQLGTGNRVDSARPVPVPGLTGVKQVAAGFGHMLALREDNTVWAWGWNGLGQLGDGTTVDRLTPVQVLPVGPIRTIAAGGAHSLVVDFYGYVWAWGYNAYGQLGMGTAVDSSIPRMVPLLTNIFAVSAGFVHSLAISRYDGGQAWGWNAYGQLGDGTTTDRWSPVRSVYRPHSVSAGVAHSIARLGDGTLVTFGYNGQGELGDGSRETRPAPVEVAAPQPILNVAAGWFHNTAVGIANDVVTWGFGGQGRLGDGSTDDGLVPALI